MNDWRVNGLEHENDCGEKHKKKEAREERKKLQQSQMRRKC
jgi:hypothetical protein